jgi:hypothetical protein
MSVAVCETRPAGGDPRGEQRLHMWLSQIDMLSRVTNQIVPEHSATRSTSTSAAAGEGAQRKQKPCCRRGARRVDGDPRRFAVHAQRSREALHRAASLHGTIE